MQTITTTSQFVPVSYAEHMVTELNKTYGLLSDLPEGVDFVRKIRDKVDQRLKTFSTLPTGGDR